MKTVRSMGLKQILVGTTLLLVFISFANKIVQQPAFVKKAVCEQNSLSDEEESQEELQLIFVDFDLPVAIYRIFSEGQRRAEVPVLKEQPFGSWPGRWICYSQMKIGFAG